MAIVPLKTKLKGPAPNATGTEDDVIDEAIQLFRANVLFASFEVQSPADRVLIFLTLFITQILQRMQKAGNKSSAQKLLFELAKENFPSTCGGQIGRVVRLWFCMVRVGGRGLLFTEHQ
jgi:actin related protein 2/3 complex subunit 3